MEPNPKSIYQTKQSTDNHNYLLAKTNISQQRTLSLRKLNLHEDWPVLLDWMAQFTFNSKEFKGTEKYIQQAFDYSFVWNIYFHFKQSTGLYINQTTKMKYLIMRFLKAGLSILVQCNCYFIKWMSLSTHGQIILQTRMKSARYYIIDNFANSSTFPVYTAGSSGSMLKYFASSFIN